MELVSCKNLAAEDSLEEHIAHHRRQVLAHCAVVHVVALDIL